MAAPTYNTDLTLINDCSSTSSPDTWAEPTGMTAGTTIAAQTDFYIQGSACISKLTNTTGTSGAGFTDASGATTLPSGEAFWFWIYHIGAKALDTKANGGLQVIVGNTLANYYAFYLEGNNTYTLGGWKRVPIDPTISAARNRTQGTPDGTWAAYGGGCVQTAAVAGASLGVDYVTYGRDVMIEFGSTVDGYATFSGAATTDSSNAWGLLQLINGAYYMQGRLLLGTTTNAVDFRDTGGGAVFIQNTEKVSAGFNEIEIQNASSRVDWTAISFTSLGTTSPGKLTVTDNADVNIIGCSFTGMSTFSLKANTSITTSTFRNCNTVTAPGSDLTGTSMLTPVVAADTSAVVWDVSTDTDGLLNNMTFSKGTNAHHAIELGTTSPTTVTLRGITFTGFNASNAQNDSVIHVKRTSGTVTINTVGCSGTVSYKSAGADVVIVADPVTVLINVKNTSGSNIQNANVLLKAIAGGPFPAEVTVTIANSGTTATVTHTSHAMATNDKVYINGASHAANNGIFSITKINDNSYSYTMGSSPGSNPTGTIKATYVAVTGLTDASGNISTSRVFSADQPVTGWVRKGSASPYYKTSVLGGSVDSATGYTNNTILLSDE